MESRTRHDGRMMLRLLTSILLMMVLAACSSGDDIDIDEDLVAVPGYESAKWVTDKDIHEDDIDLLIDLAARIEFMRLDLIQMLSNNFEGKLFCGVGPKTDPKPSTDCFTTMMIKEKEYLAALDRLEKTNLMTPTTTRSDVGNVRKIFSASREEQERVYGLMMENLDKMNIWSNDKAQQELFDFYKDLEPDYVKQMGVKDARDFFKKLNTGQLNAYVLSVNHIWSFNGARTDNSVSDYSVLAFTGKQEHLQCAYNVCSKVAVAAGELYFSGIDRFTGGYGGKIIEFGDMIKKKIDDLKLAIRTATGNASMQEINTYVVNRISGDVQDALGEVLGDDNFGKELVQQIVSEISDHIVKQCTVEEAEKASGDEQTVAKKRDEIAKAADKAIVDIVTDFKSKNLVLITDDTTGKVTITKADDQGRALVALQPGGKTITVINSNGERLTKHVVVTEGFNSVNMQTTKASIYTNPFELDLAGKGDYEIAIVVTNCKYVKKRIIKQEDWWEAELLGSGKDVQLKVTAKPNPESKARSGSLVLEAYEDNASGAKPAATYTVKFTQYAAQEEQGTLKVSPTELNFDAKGGTQRIEMETAGYEYFGGFTDDDCDSWITCSTSNNGVNVTVSANTSDSPREGIVYAFVTNNANAHSLDDITYATVKVTQAANQPQEEKLYISSGMANLYYAGTWRSDNNFKATDEGVTITPSGKGAKVQIVRTGNDYNAVWQYTISFDVDDLSLVESKKAKISNFRYELNKEGGEYDYYHLHIAWTKTTITMESAAPKAQESSGFWKYNKDDLTYYSKETIHYDRWREDWYSEAVEKTVVNEVTDVTDGSDVTIALNVKKE